MAKNNGNKDKEKNEIPKEYLDVISGLTPMWQLNITELDGHNLEAKGRDEVNELLGQGWKLLYIYTLKYEEDGVWRERPMAILGKTA